MNDSRDVIGASYRACHRVCGRSASNFPIAFRLLPRAKRRAMEALYAFMRHTDDLADQPQPGQTPAAALVAWRTALRQVVAGADAPSDLVGELPGRDVLPALGHAVREFGIPVEHIEAVIDGVKWTFGPRTYATFDDLAVYCHRVASAVGIACIHVWGFRGPEAFGPARSAGLALQLTNILRDVEEDARQDRIYLPLADVAECGYSIDALRHGMVNPAFHRLMELELARAERFYDEAAQLVPLLHPDGQRIFGVMTAIYHELLHEIGRRPGDVFLRRIRLSTPRKLWLAARWTLGPRS